jgi:hypothetical protein
MLGDVAAAAEAKRRGRPPGSKNVPKAEPIAPLASGVVLGAPADDAEIGTFATQSSV